MAKPSKSDEAKRFDPRFSPEFQPGFDARVHRESPPAVIREPSSARSRGAVITRPVSRQQDAADDAAAEGEAGATHPDHLPVTVTGEGATAHPTGDVDGVDSLEWWRRVNPFLVALGVAGVGLIGVAAFWMFRVYELATNPYTQQFDYLIMQFAMFGAPIVGCLGVAALLTILVVLAVRWRR